MNRAKPNWWIIAFAMVLMAPPGYKIFELLHLHAAQPVYLAAFAWGALDVAAIVSGFVALQVAEDGDASWPWNLGLVLGVLVSVTAQFWAAVLDHDSMVTALVLSALSVWGVALFEGQLRRVHRKNARADGRLAMPRARVTTEQWFRFRKASNIATTIAVAHPELDAESIFAAGLAVLQRNAPKPVIRQRKSLNLPVGYAGFTAMAITSGAGQSADGPAETSTDDPPAPPVVPDPPVRVPSISALVRDAVALHGLDVPLVIAEVHRTNPTANPDSIRRYVRDHAKVRSA